MEISDAKLKSMLGKPWSSWNLPGCSTDIDSEKLREVHKPKIQEKPKDHCNLLPHGLKLLYGTRPELEFFSVTKCPSCSDVMKTQWITRHFKRDSFSNIVCRRTEMIVHGSRVLGKAIPPIYDIKESTAKDPFKPKAYILSEDPAAGSLYSGNAFVCPPQLSPTRQKHSSHKTEHSSNSTSHTVAKSKSSSKSDSHSKKHSSSHSSSSKHKSSSKSSVPSSSFHSSSSKKESSKSHSKPHSSTGSYVLSIPSDDASHNDSVESILLSSKHIVTGKHKSSEPEYEQLKFYADSSEKRKSSSESDSKSSHKVHFSSHLENFKIPLKSKSSSSSTSGAVTDASKKSKSSHSHSSKSSHDSSKLAHRHSSGSSKPVPSLTIISEGPKMTPIITHIMPEIKEKSSSHSKKKKKKKDRDEPRKIIPLKERAFNPNQHCGVVVHNDGPCTRSLTCKTHSVASRRAVPGRSQPFDALLAAHKKARDEEKAKSKELIDDVKSKGKKSGVSLPLLLDSDSSSSSLPQPSSVGKTSTHSNTSAKLQSSPVSLLPAPTTGPSSNGKHNTSSGTSGSKSGHSASHSNLHRQLSKAPPAAKPSNRPVIILDEKKEVQGTSLFELVREPENHYVYSSAIEAPKLLVNIKDLDGKNSRSNALSEWNPLDQINVKGNSGAYKKKGVKEPLLVPFKVGGLETSFAFRDASPARKETAKMKTAADVVVEQCVFIRRDLEKLYQSKLPATTPAAAPAVKEQTNDALKRKSSTTTVEMASPKKSRLVTSPHKLYDSLLFKSPQKQDSFPTKAKPTDPNTTLEKQRPSEPTQEENTVVVKTAVDMIKTHLNDIGYSSRESNGSLACMKIFTDSLAPEARAFVQNYVQANSDTLEKLSPEEVSQHAFEMSNRCILS